VLAHSLHRPRSGMAGAQFTDLWWKGLVEYPLRPNGKMCKLGAVHGRCP
jgi:hypothetical protein